MFFAIRHGPIRTKQRPLRLTLAVVIAVAAGIGGAALASEVLRVRIDAETKYQVIDGFGASDAWQCQFVGKHWPIEKRELGNYARFVRPGMVRVQCDVQPAQSVEDGVLASAYRGTANSLVLVLTNLSAQEQACDLGLPQPMEMYVTDRERNLALSRQPGTAFRLPPRSVATACWREK